VILAVFALLVILFVILPLVGVALWFVISTAVVGIFFGALGRLIVPGYQPIGVLATICCGWIGALVGGAIGRGAGVGHFATILIEVGLSAAAVAVWSGTHRGEVAGARSRQSLPR
jgi:uncharacterized membrane protein YeaQ/YmgE (transglycosylase-associated protein family)